MIKYIDGDLVRMAVNNEFELISHCCNCFCTMGSGIAPQIKVNFPEAYVVDCATKCGSIDKLGTISYTVNSNPIIVNIYGQFDYRGRRQGKMDLDYNALRSGFKLIKEKFSGKKIGLPLIGCGLAGGDWNIVSKIIEEELHDEDVTVVNYKK